MRRLLPWFLLLLLIALPIAWKGAAGTRKDIRKPAREEAPSHEAGAAREDAAAARTKRPGAAEAKLRSLLEVRKGEMACVHLSPALTEQLLAHVQGASGPAMDPADGAPAVVGVLNPDIIPVLFAGTTEEIQGSIDASDDSFEWRGERMVVTGTSVHEGDHVKLDFTATEGASNVQCATSLPPGAVVFLRSGGDRPEGLLLAIGGDRRDEIPPGDIER